MTQANIRLVNDSVSPVERAFRKNSILPLGKNGKIEPDADLFTVAEQVDLAERDFHNAVALRNEAHISYLRQPSTKTRETFEAAKMAEAIALEILDAEVGWLANTRATTVIGLKLKASYTSMKGKLTDSIVEDILQF